MADAPRYHIATTSDTREQVEAALKGDEAPVEKADAETDPEAEDLEEEDPAAETGHEDDPEEEEGEPRKKPSRFQKRIDRMRWENAQLQRQVDMLAGQIQSVTAKPAADASAAPDPNEFTEPEPDIDNFETVEAWTKELSAWNRRKVLHDIKVDQWRVEADQRSRESNVVMQAHINRVNDFRKTHADFDEVAQEALADGLPVTPAMNAHFINSDMGPELMYTLAKDPAECHRIAKLTFGKQLVELGKLEAKLESRKPAAKPSPNNPAGVASRTVTNGSGKPQPKLPPPPIKPQRGIARGSKNPSEMSPQEFKEWRKSGGGR